MDEPAQGLRALQARIDQLEREAQQASTQRDAFSQVRDAIWLMHSSDDLQQMIQTVWRALTTLGIPFKFCGVNIIDPDANPAIVIYNMTNADGEVHVYEYEEITDKPLVQIWRRQQVAYRRDLQQEDPYCEAYMLKLGIYSIVDVPFSHGTLAISITQADAFSDGDLGVFQYLAGSLSGGFRRLQDLRNLELESEVVERRQAESAVKVSLAVQRVRNVFLRMESEDDWDYVVLHCQREIENVIDCDGFGINFVDMETNTFDPRWADDDDSILRGKSNDLPAAIREAIESNSPIYRRNQHEIEQLGGVAHPERLSIIDVPFNGGTIAINSRREEAFSPPRYRDFAAIRPGHQRG